jgi:preprotein translocase subunit YajC
MKKIIIILLLTSGITAVASHRANAQVSTAQDVQQLVLDIEKLTQFKAILSDMQSGYTILTQGYGQVKDISEGNFNLHSAFLNSLMAVSPEIRKYGRIADIIENQASIVSEYKATLKQANAGGHFNAQEMVYMNGVFSSLLTQSLNNLTTLANVITASNLRMSDAERLQAIDHIYSDTQSKLVFLRNFDSQVAILSLQREKAQNDVNTLQKLY